MIPLDDIRRVVTTGANRVSYRIDEVLPKAMEDDGAGPAVILVSDVTDAVKQVDDGMIVGSLDRDLLWAVRGFELDREVIGAIGDDRVEIADLVDGVRAAGYRWRVVPVSPSDS